MKKWTIENTETLQYFDITLHRVVLTKDCKFGKKGDKMGWVEKEENLQDDAMVFDNAKICDSAVVLGSARVHNNAVIFNDARICDHALVYDNVSVSDSAVITGHTELHGDVVVSGGAKVYDNAHIYDNARIYDNALIYGNAVISDHATVANKAQVLGRAVVCGYAQVYGDAIVYGEAQISGNARISCNTKVFGNANVSGSAKVLDNAKIYEHAVVSGTAEVSGYAIIRDRANVFSDKDYIVFKNWWSSNRYFTYLRSIDMYAVGSIDRYAVDCFQCTGKELIKKAYKDSKISGRNYEKVVKYVESIKKELNNEDENRSFIKWLFNDITKSHIFGIIAMVFGITGIVLNGKTYVASIASAIGIVALVLMVNESLIQFKKAIKNRK